MGKRSRPKMREWESEKRIHDKLLGSLKDHFEEDELEMRRNDEQNPDRRSALRDLMREMLEMERGDDDMEEDEEEEYEDSEGEEEDSAPMCPFDADEDEADEEDKEEVELPKDKRKQLAILVMSKKAGKKAM